MTLFETVDKLQKMERKPKFAVSRFKGTYVGCPVVEDSVRYENESQYGHTLFTIKNNPELTERIVDTANASQDMFEVLSCFQKGDASNLEAIAEYMHKNNYDAYWMETLGRMIRAARRIEE